MSQCKERLTLRKGYVDHKAEDVMREIQVRASHRHNTHIKSEMSMLYQRYKTLKSISGNTFQTMLTLDGLMDSVVTIGVMKETEQALAASIAVSATCQLMDSISEKIETVSEVSDILSETICDSNTDDLTLELEAFLTEPTLAPLPDVPTTPLPTVTMTEQNDTRTVLATG